jgi:Cys-rich protein (TIGR01571 family)
MGPSTLQLSHSDGNGLNAALPPSVARSGAGNWSGQWSDGLCDWSSSWPRSADQSCWSCLAPFVRWSLTMTRSGVIPSYGVSLTIMLIPWIMLAIFLYLRSSTTNTWPFVAVWFCVIAIITIGAVGRVRLRQKYGIGDSSTLAHDCAVHALCQCCALSQEARHVDRLTGHL